MNVNATLLSTATAVDAPDPLDNATPTPLFALLGAVKVRDVPIDGTAANSIVLLPEKLTIPIGTFVGMVLPVPLAENNPLLPDMTMSPPFMF